MTNRVPVNKAGPFSKETIQSLMSQLNADPNLRTEFATALRQDFEGTLGRVFDFTPRQQDALRRISGVPQDALAIFIHTIALSIELGMEPQIEFSTEQDSDAHEPSQQRRISVSCKANSAAGSSTNWECSTSIVFAWN